MRWIFPFFLIAFHLTNAQVSELFGDGDFVQNPQWQGTENKFEVDPMGRLHLKAPAEASDAWLFTPSAVSEEATWELDVTMQFDPSSQNYCRIYLMADSPDPSQIKNGFYLTLGYTDDDVSLYKVVNGTAQKIIDGTNGRLTMASVSVKVKAVYSVVQGWEVFVNTNGNWVSEGKKFSSHNISSQWFGIFCKYTATRSDKFYFDNILVSGVPLQDRTKPYVLGVLPLTANKLMVRFSEPIDIANWGAQSLMLWPLGASPNYVEATAASDTLYLSFADAMPDDFFGTVQLASLSDAAGNFLNDTSIGFTYSRLRLVNAQISSSKSVKLEFSKPLDVASVSTDKFVPSNGAQHPFSCSFINANTIELFFDQEIPNKTKVLLQVSQLRDFLGDTLRTIDVSFTYFVAERHDVVFSELMPDPEPANDLPASEYIELYNNTPFDVDLSGFWLMMSDKKYIIAQGTLRGGQHAVLVAQNEVGLWSVFENVVPMKSFPSLTNTAGKIVLFSDQNRVMDVMEYNATWREGGFKDEGGWSFERIDPANFSGINNWAYSMDLRGGTPGKSNSVDAHNIDSSLPRVDYIELMGSNTLAVRFSEPMDASTANAFVNSHPQIGQVMLDSLFCRTLSIVFKDGFAQGTQYELAFPSEAADFAGNKLKPYFPLVFAKPELIPTNGLIINEVLFNPESERSDFVEIYNPTANTFLLSDVYLARFKGEAPERLLKVTDAKIPVLPHSYWVVSDNVAEWAAKSPSPWWLMECTLPSMPDTEGDVGLMLLNGTVIDRLTYSEKWHYPLLNSKEGVSLERLSSMLPTQQASNWQSASSTSGYSTPTYANSQSVIINEVADKTFSIAPQLFTPDGDGTDDYILVSLNGENSGGSATVKVFDSMGSEVKTLANNCLVGTLTQFKWDGTSKSGLRAAPGIYVVWCRVFFSSGKVVEQRGTCVLGLTAK